MEQSKAPAKMHRLCMTRVPLNQEFFCAESPSKGNWTSANIVMTTIRPLTIDVDEEDMSAWVSAGVMVSDLMIFLANYITPSSPRGRAEPSDKGTMGCCAGYFIGTTPHFVNQTIAGAIATNTHGYSLRNGSLSNQAIGFRVILANGTITEITPDRHPLYFKAFQVNVGRLGVVTDVKLRLRPETFMKRTVRKGIPKDVFMSELQHAQRLYRSNGTLPNWLQNDFSFSFSLDDFAVRVFTLGCLTAF